MATNSIMPKIRNIDSKKWQNEIEGRLRNIFNEFRQVEGYSYDVVSEWPAFSQRMKNVYAPSSDISIGPFNDSEEINIQHIYNQIVNEPTITEFVSQLYSQHQNNLNDLSRDLNPDNIEHYSIYESFVANVNSRCLFAIEIENTSTKKHIMGSIVNAASLGRIGIGIGYSESAYRSFIRIVNYLTWLKEVGKSYYPVGNFLVVTKAQFEEILNDFERGLDR